MSWLMRQDTVLASVEIASSFKARTKGLLGRDAQAAPGAILLIPAKGVHTLGMKFAIDVAYLRRSRSSAGPTAASAEPTAPHTTKPTAASAGPTAAHTTTYTVLATTTMAPNRIGRPRLRSTAVLEAAAGAFERWHLKSGDEVQIVGESAS